MQQWFVLNHIAPGTSDSAKISVDRFNQKEGTSIKIFAPTFITTRQIGNQIVTKKAPLTYHYVFVQGTPQEIKSLCSLPNGFSFVLNRAGNDRYLTVTDEQMQAFMIIARAYSNSLPYYSLEDVDLEEGDLVEIIDGQFAGLTGTFIPKNKSTVGNVVIAVNANLGTVLYDISAKHVKVLKFAQRTKRPYDQIEAIIPRLFKAMRLLSDGNELPKRTITDITVFVRRFEETRLDNHKIEAKLQALLQCAATIIGNKDTADKAATKYARRAIAVTNNWTLALIALLKAVPSGDTELMRHGFSLIADDLDKPSRSQQQLIDEYMHYMSRHTYSLI